MSNKPIDDFLGEFDEAEKKKASFMPMINNEINKLEYLDKQINQLENQKKARLNNLSELFDSAMITSHTLQNGYHVGPDNRFKIELTDIGAFLKWLKENKEPVEVMKFLGEAIKLGNLKRFVEQEYNHQRENGEVEPSVEGVKFGKLTFRKLGTKYKKIQKRKSLDGVRVTSERRN